MRRRKSGECWSNCVTISVKEELLAPAFWALIVMNFNLALGKEGTGVWLAGRGVGRSAASGGSGVPSDLEVGWADMPVSCPSE